jgi:uncharacterized protein (DUF1330 family)
MSSAYVVAHVEVKDPAAYEAYKRLSSIAIQAHGGEICVRGGAVEPLEGDWNPERVVIVKYPSIEQARAWYDSVEYSRARQARDGIAIMRMIVVAGI